MPTVKLDGLYFKITDKKMFLIREEDEPREGLEIIENGFEVLQQEMEL